MDILINASVIHTYIDHGVWVTPTANLRTKILPTKIRWLKTSGKFPMDLRIQFLKFRILLESNPWKSRILVRRLAAVCGRCEKVLPEAHKQQRTPHQIDIHQLTNTIILVMIMIMIQLLLIVMIIMMIITIHIQHNTCYYYSNDIRDRQSTVLFNSFDYD